MIHTTNKYTYMLGATREAQGAYRAGHPKWGNKTLINMPEHIRIRPVQTLAIRSLSRYSKLASML